MHQSNQPAKTNSTTQTKQRRTAGQYLGNMTDQNDSKHYEILTQLRSRVCQQTVKNSDQNSISFPVKLIAQNSKNKQIRRTAEQSFGNLADQNRSKLHEILTQLITRIGQQSVKISDPNSNNFSVKQPQQIRQFPEKQTDRNQTCNLFKPTKICIKLVQITQTTGKTSTLGRDPIQLTLTLKKKWKLNPRKLSEPHWNCPSIPRCVVCLVMI